MHSYAFDESFGSVLRSFFSLFIFLVISGLFLYFTPYFFISSHTSSNTHSRSLPYRLSLSHTTFYLYLSHFPILYWDVMFFLCFCWSFHLLWTRNTNKISFFSPRLKDSLESKCLLLRMLLTSALLIYELYIVHTHAFSIESEFIQIAI